MRKLVQAEIPFWNTISLSILIDYGITVEVNDGLIVGVESLEEQLLESMGVKKNVQNES